MLPNLIVIGAQKCGTTSLHYYLSLHPQIAMSKEKELEFFIQERNWHRGLAWYESHFREEAKIRGESSPNYTNYTRFSGVAERMHSVVPHTKLIYIVRDPIERIVSQYIHQYSDERENRPIQEALGSSDNNQYINRSLYYTQLKQYLAYYSESQILVIATEDLQYNRRPTLRRVFEYLGVEPEFYCRRYSINRHSTSRKRRKDEIGVRLAQTLPLKMLKRVPQRFRWPIEDLLYFPFSKKIERPKLTDELRKDLASRLKEDVDKLRAFAGEKFEQWSL